MTGERTQCDLSKEAHSSKHQSVELCNELYPDKRVYGSFVGTGTWSRAAYIYIIVRCMIDNRR